MGFQGDRLRSWMWPVTWVRWEWEVGGDVEKKNVKNRYSIMFRDREVDDDCGYVKQM